MKNIQIGAALKTMRKNRVRMGKRSGLSPHGNIAAAL